MAIPNTDGIWWRTCAPHSFWSVCKVSHSSLETSYLISCYKTRLEWETEKRLGGFRYQSSLEWMISGYGSGGSDLLEFESSFTRKETHSILKIRRTPALPWQRAWFGLSLATSPPGSCRRRRWTHTSCWSSWWSPSHLECPTARGRSRRTLPTKKRWEITGSKQRSHW